MNRDEAAALVKAFDDQEQLYAFDPANIDNIMIEGRLTGGSGGPRGGYMRKTLFPTDPEWDSVVAILTGQVSADKAAAAATIATAASVGTTPPITPPIT